MDLPPVAWVTIVLTIVGFVWSVGFWIVRRSVERWDKLEETITGRDGVLQKLATLEGLDNKLSGIAEEGVQREERITRRIRLVHGALDTDIKKVRGEIDTLNRRLDGAQLQNRR